VKELLALFDAYNLTARVAPALLCVLPPVASGIAIFSRLPSKDVIVETLCALLSFCILYLLASVARERGKKIEPSLLAAWNGWPSTALLRHADSKLDPKTKSRYRGALQGACPDLVFPSEAEEAENTSHADQVYRSATLRLIEMRRGTQYQILHVTCSV
jgi:hypothetical protein